MCILHDCTLSFFLKNSVRWWCNIDYTALTNYKLVTCLKAEIKKLLTYGWLKEAQE